MIEKENFGVRVYFCVGLSQDPREPSQLTLSRCPTLVLSAAHKPSKNITLAAVKPRPPVSRAGCQDPSLQETPANQAPPAEDPIQPVSAFANQGVYPHQTPMMRTLPLPLSGVLKSGCFQRLAASSADPMDCLWKTYSQICFLGSYLASAKTKLFGTS